MTLELSKISNVHLADIDLSDYPDFWDARVVCAEYEGRPMSEAELDLLNDNRSLVYEAVMRQIN